MSHDSGKAVESSRSTTDQDHAGWNLLPADGERQTLERLQSAGQPVGAICAIATGRHRELLAESAPTLAAYAQLHGWSLVLSSEQLSDRPASWNKVLLVSELLNHYEFVWCIDADAIIVDLERNVLDEIDDDADIWFSSHPQERKVEASVLNAGVILARSTQFTKGLLEAVWAKEQFIHHNWWENAALLDLLGYSLDSPYPKLRTSEWDQRIGGLDLAWNSVPGYCESPCSAINHHARSDHDDFNLRRDAMRADRLKAVANFPEHFVGLRAFDTPERAVAEAELSALRNTKLFRLSQLFRHLPGRATRARRD